MYSCLLHLQKGSTNTLSAIINPVVLLYQIYSLYLEMWGGHVPLVHLRVFTHNFYLSN